MDTINLSTGIYTLSVKSDNYLYSAKLVSQNATTGNTSLSYVSTNAFKSDKSIKGAKSTVEMQYNTDDRLLITTTSGGMSTVKSIIPIATTTETFELTACTDGDGTHYPTIKIGTQIWMARNLNTTKYADDTEIPFYSKDQGYAFGSLLDEDAAKGFSYFDIENNENGEIYGALYTFGAATNGTHYDGTNNVQGVCPTGWHLPSDAEWKTLEMQLGMTQTEADDEFYRGTDEGGKLKATSTWTDPNTGATNSSGFSALSGGSRQVGSGNFDGVSYGSYWWSATQIDSSHAWNRRIRYDRAEITRYNIFKSNGYAVRCVRDID